MTDTNSPSPPAAAVRLSRDWTAILIPDLRVAVALGYFALAYKLIDMIGNNPRLLAVSSFIGIATAILGTGGLGLIATFLFGGTKTGSEVMKAQSAAVIASSPPTTTGPGQ